MSDEGACVLGQLGRLFGHDTPTTPGTSLTSWFASWMVIPKTPRLQAAASVVRELTGVMGFVPPSWDVLATSLRPVHHEPEEFEPGTEVGSTKRVLGWTVSSGTTFSVGWMTPRKPSHVLRAVLELVLRCQLVPHAESHGWNPICFVCFFCAASVCPSP